MNKNEIKKELFSQMVITIEKMAEFQSRDFHSASYMLLDAFEGTKAFIRNYNTFNTDDLLHQSLSEKLLELNKVYPLKDLFIEAHFLLKALKEKSVEIDLHKKYLEEDIRITKEISPSSKFVSEIIIDDFVNYANKNQMKISDLSDLFVEVLKEENASIKEIYEEMLNRNFNYFEMSKVNKI